MQKLNGTTESIPFFRKTSALSELTENIRETPNIAAVYGCMQCLRGGVVLAKLAKLCYNTNLHLQRECIIMGSELLAAPFRVIMFHPQDKIDYCEYRMKEFLPDIGLLADKQALQPVDLLNGLDIISEMLIDYEMYERVLPLATLMNYAATDIVKSTPYMIKARVLKGIALSCLGYHSQALNCFYQVTENKDRIATVFNPSEPYIQNHVSSFKFKDPKYLYRNDLPPENEANIASINYLMTVNPDITQRGVSPLLNSQLVYLKCIILLNVCKDPFDSTPAIDDYRHKFFNSAEDGFKNCIRMIAEEEVVPLIRAISQVTNSSLQEESHQKYLGFLKRKLK